MKFKKPLQIPVTSSNSLRASPKADIGFHKFKDSSQSNFKDAQSKGRKSIQGIISKNALVKSPIPITTLRKNGASSALSIRHPSPRMITSFHALQKVNLKIETDSLINSQVISIDKPRKQTIANKKKVTQLKNTREISNKNPVKIRHTKGKSLIPDASSQQISSTDIHGMKSTKHIDIHNETAVSKITTPPNKAGASIAFPKKEMKRPTTAAVNVYAPKGMAKNAYKISSTPRASQCNDLKI